MKPGRNLSYDPDLQPYTSSWFNKDENSKVRKRELMSLLNNNAQTTTKESTIDFIKYKAYKARGKPLEIYIYMQTNK